MFFVPGYTITKALFPEWRVRGSAAPRVAVTIVTLSFVTSVGVTVLVGFGLLSLSPDGFQASWSDPVLQAWLAGIALVAFVVGFWRGAYRRDPPEPRPKPAADPGSEGAWELQRRLDGLRRQSRRLEHELRRAGASTPQGERIQARIDDLEREARDIRAGRQREYAR